MLNARAVRLGGGGYYVEDLAAGREEGPVPAAAGHGWWFGEQARRLGLVGPVDPEAFRALIEGRNPATGAAERAFGVRKVGGYDLTFSAPKSVSVLHALGDPSLRAVVERAHVAGVDAALGVLAGRAADVRVGSGPAAVRVPTEGMFGASFLHRTSRALDPHLHTHAVVANRVHEREGRWRALDARGLFASVRMGGAIYRAELRRTAVSAAGLTFEAGRSGIAEVAGVPAELRSLFSQRAAEIREALASGTARTRTGAFHATREPKDRGVTIDELVSRWHDRVEAAGIDVPWRRSPERLVSAAGRCHLDELDAGLLAARLERVMEATGRTLVPADHVVAHVADAHVQGARASTVLARAGALLEVGRGRVAERPPGALEVERIVSHLRSSPDAARLLVHARDREGPGRSR